MLKLSFEHKYSWNAKSVVTRQYQTMLAVLRAGTVQSVQCTELGLVNVSNSTLRCFGVCKLVFILHIITIPMSRVTQV